MSSAPRGYAQLGNVLGVWLAKNGIVEEAGPESIEKEAAVYQ